MIQGKIHKDEQIVIGFLLTLSMFDDRISERNAARMIRKLSSCLQPEHFESGFYSDIYRIILMEAKLNRIPKHVTIYRKLYLDDKLPDDADDKMIEAMNASNIPAEEIFVSALRIRQAAEIRRAVNTAVWKLTDWFDDGDQDSFDSLY